MNFKEVIRRSIKMLMKKFIIMVLMLTSGILAEAQQDTDQNQRDPKAMEKIQALRTAYISEKLGLTPAQAEKFWPVYREFTQERAKLRDQFKEAQRNINPANPNPKAEQDLVNLGLEVKQKELNLEKDYSGRLMKVITAQQVLNLRKAEQEFRELVMQQLQQRRMMQQRKENFRDKQQLKRNN
jgi:hypothetical protein